MVILAQLQAEARERGRRNGTPALFRPATIPRTVSEDGFQRGLAASLSPEMGGPDGRHHGEIGPMRADVAFTSEPSCVAGYAL